MSTQFVTGKRTLSTGDYVISVSEIFDKLQSKVDANTLEQLLRDIISERRPQVRPGELITAELINQILAELESLETRVTKLEAGAIVSVPTQGQVVVTQLVPPENIRIEDELRIIGREFYFSRGAARVLLNGAERPIKTGVSNDTELRIDIPAGTPLGTATLRVSNSFNGVDRTINILPALTPLLGNPVVRFLRVNPTLIQTNSTTSRVQTFFYQLDATGMSRSATFTIDPFISVSAWDGRARIVNEDGSSRSNEFFLDPGQRVTFGVAVDVQAPAGGAPTRFTTRIDVTSEGRIWQLADNSFINGQTVLPSNPGIQLGTPQVSQAAGTFDDATNTIRGQARLTMPVGFTVADTYTPIAGPVDGSTLASNNWSRNPTTIPAATITDQMLRTAGGTFGSSLQLTFVPQAGARTVDIEVGYGNATSRTVDHFTLTP
jgi:hypothetical protein